MPVTDVSIANSALTKMGAGLISSLSEDEKRAEILNANYEQVRDATLRASDWRFATKRAQLMPTGITPDFEWDFAFDKPADCLRILDPDPDTIAHVEENGQILCNEATLDLRYIFRNVDPTDWDPCFAESFAWRLARDTCYAITQSAKLVEICDAGYKQSLAEARSMNAISGSPKTLIIDTWTGSRRR